MNHFQIKYPAASSIRGWNSTDHVPRSETTVWLKWAMVQEEYVQAHNFHFLTLSAHSKLLCAFRWQPSKLPDKVLSVVLESLFPPSLFTPDSLFPDNIGHSYLLCTPDTNPMSPSVSAQPSYWAQEQPIQTWGMIYSLRVHWSFGIHKPFFLGPFSDTKICRCYCILVGLPNPQVLQSWIWRADYV